MARGSKSGRRSGRSRGVAGGSQLLSIRRPISPSLVAAHLALTSLTSASTASADAAQPMDTLEHHSVPQRCGVVLVEETADTSDPADKYSSGRMEIDRLDCIGGSGGPASMRERMHLHWREMSGRVVIPDVWGREEWLQDWVGTGLVEEALRPPGLLSARDAMINDCLAAERRAAAATTASSHSRSPSSSATSNCGSGLHSNSMPINVKAR